MLAQKLCLLAIIDRCSAISRGREFTLRSTRGLFVIFADMLSSASGSATSLAMENIMLNRITTALFAIATAGSLSLGLPAAFAVDYPTPKQADWTAKDFSFHTGHVM